MERINQKSNYHCTARKGRARVGEWWIRRIPENCNLYHSLLIQSFQMKCSYIRLPEGKIASWKCLKLFELWIAIRYALHDEYTIHVLVYYKTYYINWEIWCTYYHHRLLHAIFWHWPRMFAIGSFSCTALSMDICISICRAWHHQCYGLWLLQYIPFSKCLQLYNYLVSKS